MCQISQICQLYRVLLVIKQVKMGILTVRLYAGTDAGGSTFLPSPALPSRPVPSPTHFLPLEVGPPYTPWRSGGNNVCYTVGSGAEPRLKTNELSESLWWQSFWVFWSACFTADRSQFSTRPQLRGCFDTPSPPSPCLRLWVQVLPFSNHNASKVTSQNFAYVAVHTVTEAKQ